MELFDILSYSFSSIIWGILISVLFMTLFFVLIKGWYKNSTFSLISYFVGMILFLLLAIQCILIVGSLKIINSTDEYEQVITYLVSDYTPDSEITQTQSSNIIDKIIDDYPILSYYISGGKFYGFSAKELPHAITSELRSVMSWYIFRRLLWCLGFVIVATICVIKSMSKRKSSFSSNLKTNESYDNF